MYLLKEHGEEAAPRNILSAFQRGFNRSFERAAQPLPGTPDSGWWRIAGCLFRDFSALCLLRLPAASLAGAGLLSQHRQRRIHSACARQDGAAHRRDGAAVRSGGGSDPAEIPAKELNNILDNIGLPYSPMNTMHIDLGADWRRRRRYSGVAQRGSPSDGELRSRSAPEAAAGVSRRNVLFPAGRHRDADSELRTAGADRCADRGQRYRSQPCDCRQDARPNCGRFRD